MALIGVYGEDADMRLLVYATNNAPSLVIDCSNSANPHLLIRHSNLEDMSKVYVVEIELLYSLRDSLKKAKAIADGIGAGCIIITNYSHLFSYDDEEEKTDVIRQSWRLMKKLSLDHEVYVSLPKHEKEDMRAYCDRCIDGSHILEPANSL